MRPVVVPVRSISWFIVATNSPTRVDNKFSIELMFS